MDPHTAKKAIDIGYFVIIFGIPSILIGIPTLLRRRKGGKRTIGAGILISVPVVWSVLVIYRESIELPVNYELARLNGNETYDGVGGNAALCLMGWLVALIGCLPAALARMWFDERRTPSFGTHT